MPLENRVTRYILIRFPPFVSIKVFALFLDKVFRGSHLIVSQLIFMVYVVFAHIYGNMVFQGKCVCVFVRYVQHSGVVVKS